MPTQEEIILSELERRGGSITTYDLMDLHISQYQARLKGLREKLNLKGWILTEAEPILDQKGNNLYRLIKPHKKQGSLFPQNDECN